MAFRLSFFITPEPTDAVAFVLHADWFSDILDTLAAQIGLDDPDRIRTRFVHLRNGDAVEIAHFEGRVLGSLGRELSDDEITQCRAALAGRAPLHFAA